MGFKQLELGERSKYISALNRDSQIYPNFYSKVNQFLKSGRSPIILVVGDPRTGKTIAAILWAWLLKQNFKSIPLTQSIWTDIYKFIEDVASKNIRGKALIIDEAQIDLDIGAWNNLLGRALVKFNGSQAILGNILFIILPYARWLPWVQQPAVNFIIETTGGGWANYYGFKTRAADFKGKSYKILLETKKIPMIPPFFLKQKEKWETPEKKGVLEKIRESIQPKNKKKDRLQLLKYQEDRKKELKKLAKTLKL